MRGFSYRYHLMKIGYDLRFAHFPGGGGVYTAQLLQELVRIHPESRWSIYYNRWSEHQREIVRRLEEQQRAHPDNPALELLAVRAPMLSLRQHLEFLFCRPKVDLYHYPHFDLPVGLGAVPVVLTIHDLYPVLLEGYCSGAKRAYFYRLSKYNARCAARVITVSENSKKDLIEYLGIAEEKIAVIHQGYSPVFRPIDDEKLLGEIRLRLKLPEKFILYTGNHKPHKNLARLLAGYAALPKRLTNEFALVLTGATSGQTDKLRAQAAALGVAGQVKFIGLVREEDLPGLYNLAALVVLPSLYEGFGLPLVEAMACGTCVACSNTSALPEVVAEAGRRFDPCSEQEISWVLAAALDNDVGNPAVRAAVRRRAAEFSWAKTAAKTYEVYRGVAGLQS